jgi:hypothetical protein
MLHAMFNEGNPRKANAALFLLDLCAWAYALTATFHAIT